MIYEIDSHCPICDAQLMEAEPRTDAIGKSLPPHFYFCMACTAEFEYDSHDPDAVYGTFVGFQDHHEAAARMQRLVKENER